MKFIVAVFHLATATAVAQHAHQPCSRDPLRFSSLSSFSSSSSPSARRSKAAAFVGVHGGLLAFVNNTAKPFRRPRMAYAPRTQSIGSMQQPEAAEVVSAATEGNRLKAPLLVTFDLDDTLFRMRPVLLDANNVLIQRMVDLGFDTATLTEFLADTKNILRAGDCEDKPMRYTDVRIRAIEMQLSRHNGNDQTDTKSTALELYNAWEEERQQSAQRHMYPDSIEMLRELRRRYPDIVIGAVTNGGGNVFRMPDTVGPFFDFNVSAEDEKVFPQRKPTRGIFDLSFRRYNTVVSSRCEHQEDNKSNKEVSVSKDYTVDDQLAGTGICWIHVGDSMITDVGGSAASGGYAVWFHEDYEDSNDHASTRGTEQSQPLADAAKSELTAQIGKLSELPDLVDGIVQKHSRVSHENM